MNPASPDPSPEPTAVPLLGILDAYKSSVFAKDVNAFLILYDHDIHVFDMWGAWSHVGIEAWREMVVNWFGSLGSDRVVVGFDDVQMVETSDLAFIHAFVTYKALSVEGVELRAMNNRTTLVLKQKAGKWRVVHEHTSAPINHETLKVMLKR
jgi:ketosteroid isomerase-like protein